MAGGEPLLHKELHKIVQGVVARKKFAIVCTNALLLEKKIDQYAPSPYFTWSIHLDGDREMHDKSVCQQGVYDRAVSALKTAKSKGFRVTINCTFFNDADPERVAAFFDTVTESASMASRCRPATPTSALPTRSTSSTVPPPSSCSGRYSVAELGAQVGLQPVDHVP